MENKTFTPIEKLATDVKKYIELKLEAQKISSSSGAGTGVGYMVWGVVLAVLLYFTYIFVNIALAVVVADYFDSLTIGFGLVACLHLILPILLLLFRKPIVRKIRNVVAGSLVGDTIKRKHDLDRKREKIEVELIRQEYEVLKDYNRIKTQLHPVSFAANLATQFFSNEDDIDEIDQTLRSNKRRKQIDNVRNMILSLFVALESYVGVSASSNIEDDGSNDEPKSLAKDSPKDVYIVGRDDH